MIHDRFFHRLSGALCGILLLFSARAHSLQADPIVLVESGQARAILVIADDAQEMARYAAQELAEHVQKVTGISLPIVSESLAPPEAAHRVFIGVTQAARARDLPLATLEADAFILRAMEGDLYVTGAEDGEDPMRETVGSHSGTLYGVYEIIDRYLGVRWLWPGELGTHYPNLSTLTIADDPDEVIAPRFQFRRWRSFMIGNAARGYNPQLGRLSFSREGVRQYSQDLHVYKRRYRSGFSQPRHPIGHYFENWWQRYGQDHPEWFGMDAEGKRGPAENASAWQLAHVAMCFSNPDLQRFITEENWDGGQTLRMGDIDRRAFCQCPDCKAWDGPQPAQPPRFADTLYRPLMTDRYVNILKTYRELAIRRNPDAVVSFLMYWNYLPAPPHGVHLGRGYYGEFVPWGQDTIAYWPMAQEAEQWLREQWAGWQRTGVQMAYRPNYFHGGYAMPHLSTWQAGNFFKFAAARGMLGFDQDSLYGHWATRGPMLYIHMRLGVDPTLSIRDLRKEYFQAFGPAAATVERYFDAWEKYSAERPGNSLFNPVTVHTAYPESVFPPAFKLLERARELAQADENPLYARRVDFLQRGLEHAQLSRNMMATLSAGRLPLNDPQRMAQAREAMDALIAFRKEHEMLYIADFLFLSTREHRHIDVTRLLSYQGNRPADAASEPTIDMTNWTFRKDEQNVGLAEQWFAPEHAKDTWHAITVPAYWSDTPVGDYQGYGWYRLSFTLPPAMHGEDLNISFDAVDEQAWVFVNGQWVGEHTTASEQRSIHQLWNRPFVVRVDANRLIAQGENHLVVRVHNAELNGGIWGSVLISPAEDLR